MEGEWRNGMTKEKRYRRKDAAAAKAVPDVCLFPRWQATGCSCSAKNSFTVKLLMQGRVSLFRK